MGQKVHPIGMRVGIIRDWDAKWYAQGNASNKDLSLEAFNANKSLLQIFSAGDKLNGLRADKLGDEFGVK